MIIKDSSQIAGLLGWISTNKHIAFDIETDGLDQRNGRIIGFGLSNKSEAFYLPHLVWQDQALTEVLSKSQLVSVLEALKDKKLITFNGAFDLPFTKHYFGVDLLDSLWVDALLAKHTVDEEHPFQLKQIARKLYGLSAAKEQEEMMLSVKDNGGSGPGDMYKCDLNIMAKYCMQDCKLTAKIAFHYLQEIRKQGLEAFFFEDEVMPLYKEVTIPMEQGGIPVDLPLLRSSLEEINQDLAKLEDEIQAEIAPELDNFMTWYYNRHYPARSRGLFAQGFCELYKLPLPKTKSDNYSLSQSSIMRLPDGEDRRFLLGEEKLHGSRIRAVQAFLVAKEESRYPFNLSSKDHLKRLFFEKLGEKPVSRTELGNPQVDDAFLDKMAEKYNWVSKLRDFNKLVKIRGTYIERVLDEQEAGVFYPSFFQHRTTSGRMGSDIQQLPRAIEEGKASEVVRKHNNRIRYFFCAGANSKLVGADFTSLEVVVFADDSQDPALLRVINNKEDFYSRVAIEVFGLKEKYSARKNDDNYLKKVEPTIRQASKPFSLGFRYGLKPFKLSKDLNISMADAENHYNNYFTAFPKLKQRMKELREQALVFGVVRSKGGRVRHLPELKRIFNQYKSTLFTSDFELIDSLTLWEKLHDSPQAYDKIKKLRRRANNLINNAYNFPIQSFASTIVNRASIRMARRFKKNKIEAYICMNVHDELVVRCKKERAKEVASIMQDIMENTTKLSVPLEAIPEIGDVYGQIK